MCRPKYNAWTSKMHIISLQMSKPIHCPICELFEFQSLSKFSNILNLQPWGFLAAFKVSGYIMCISISSSFLWSLTSTRIFFVAFRLSSNLCGSNPSIFVKFRSMVSFYVDLVFFVLNFSFCIIVVCRCLGFQVCLVILFCCAIFDGSTKTFSEFYVQALLSFCFHQTFFWLQVYIGNGKC